MNEIGGILNKNYIILIKIKHDKIEVVHFRYIVFLIKM